CAGTSGDVFAMGRSGMDEKLSGSPELEWSVALGAHMAGEPADPVPEWAGLRRVRTYGQRTD
ncbi:MAG: hypothetical protein Q4C47_04120, partial [Planctomycetia bacterium]|nr:hypothetical protein [Planctomycetia bacterium]